MSRQVKNAVDAGEGDYELKALQRRMAAEPDNVQARLALAARYEQLGSPDLAVEHYRLAAARFPDSVEVHVALARGLRSMGLKDLAVKTLSEFIGRNPKASADAHSWLGIMEDERGNFQRGEQAHRAALVLEPKRDGLYNNLGYNLLLQGRTQDAATEFRAALKLDPHSEIARNNLALALAASPKEALAELQAHSDPAAAHNNLAVLLIEQRRYPEARRELHTALEYRRDYPAALNNLRLVSELDGQPVTIPNRQSSGLWKRFTHGVRRTFVEDDTPTPPATTSQTRPQANVAGRAVR